MELRAHFTLALDPNHRIIYTYYIHSLERTSTMKHYTLATMINDILTPLALPLMTLLKAEAHATTLRGLTTKPVLVINVTSE